MTHQHKKRKRARKKERKENKTRSKILKKDKTLSGLRQSWKHFHTHQWRVT